MHEENKKFNVVGIGEILWDLLPTGKKLGGAPANFAFNANSLGANGIIVSSIGDDPDGNEILSELGSMQLSKKYIQTDYVHPTGTVDVFLDNQGKPDYVIHQNVAWDNILEDDNLISLTQKTHAVCFGSLAQRSKVSRETIQSFIRKLSEDSIKIFDINLRQNYYNRSLIDFNLQLANCLKLNDEELNILVGQLKFQGDEDIIIQKLIDMYELNYIILTKGDKGSNIYSRGKTSHLKPSEINVVDTIGAGDAFTAAFIVGLLNHQPLNRIHHLANNLASFICTKKGATPSIPKVITEEFNT
ncbi:carbohydrate kinase [Bacteroidota bacterium]